MDIRTPYEILSFVSDTGTSKAKKKLHSMLILSFLAGVFIAFAAEGSTMAAHNLLANPNAVGFARLLTGVTFATGLMIVIMAGGELFTGNTMIIIPLLERKVTVGCMLRNWLFVYLGNFAGCLLIAWMMSHTGLFSYSGGLVGGMTIKIAVNKTQIPFLRALILGILCNWMVCLAIWTSYASRDPAGKILMVFFVISLFVISGFEHSIANMYYIPAGIFAKQNPQFVEMAQVTAEQLSNVSWVGFLRDNLLPVTLGNIIGGTFLVWVFFWLALRDKKPKEDTPEVHNVFTDSFHRLSKKMANYWVKQSHVWEKRKVVQQDIAERTERERVANLSPEKKSIEKEAALTAAKKEVRQLKDEAEIADEFFDAKAEFQSRKTAIEEKYS